MAGELQGNVAVVTGAASGIGLASTEALLAAGARVVLVDRDDAALATICRKHGDAAIPLVVDLLDPTACSTLVPRVLDIAGQIDILHANARTYVGGELVDAETAAIDRTYARSLLARCLSRSLGVGAPKTLAARCSLFRLTKPGPNRGHYAARRGHNHCA
jgi:NADP-dependent 3-hydroxy acid dehydrogenase YdfG